MRVVYFLYITMLFFTHKLGFCLSLIFRQLKELIYLIFMFFIYTIVFITIFLTVIYLLPRLIKVMFTIFPILKNYYQLRFSEFEVTKAKEYKNDLLRYTNSPQNKKKWKDIKFKNKLLGYVLSPTNKGNNNTLLTSDLSPTVKDFEAPHKNEANSRSAKVQVHWRTAKIKFGVALSSLNHTKQKIRNILRL
jgi:hypothetical protein